MLTCYRGQCVKSKEAAIKSIVYAAGPRTLQPGQEELHLPARLLRGPQAALHVSHTRSCTRHNATAYLQVLVTFCESTFQFYVPIFCEACLIPKVFVQKSPLVCKQVLRQ